MKKQDIIGMIVIVSMIAVAFVLAGGRSVATNNVSHPEKVLQTYDSYTEKGLAGVKYIEKDRFVHPEFYKDYTK